MANTGWKVPTTAVINGNGATAYDWSGSPYSAAVFADDGVLLSAQMVSAGALTNYILVQGFNLNVPAGLHADTVEVRYKLAMSAAAGVGLFSTTLLVSANPTASISAGASEQFLTLPSLSSANGLSANSTALVYRVVTANNVSSNITANRVNATSWGNYFFFFPAAGSPSPHNIFLNLDAVQMRVSYDFQYTTDVNSSEYDHEIQSVTLLKDLGVNSSEYDHEIQSVSVVGPPTLLIDSSEYDHEIASVALTFNVVVQSGEYEHELQSADITQIHVLPVTTSEYDHEITSADFTITYIQLVTTSEYDHELQLVGVVQNVSFSPFSSEYDHELQSADFTQVHALSVTASEYDHEIAPTLMRRINVGVTPRIRTTKPLLVKHYFATGM